MKEFTRDLAKASKDEVAVMHLLCERNSDYNITRNNDKRYDLLIKSYSTGKVITTIEIKAQYKSLETGNCAIETESWGKPGGIEATIADYWCNIIYTETEVIYAFISVNKLKRLISEKKYFRQVVGGDPGSGSTCYLFKNQVILDNSKICINTER